MGFLCTEKITSYNWSIRPQILAQSKQVLAPLDRYDQGLSSRIKLSVVGIFKARLEVREWTRHTPQNSVNLMHDLHGAW